MLAEQLNHSTQHPGVWGLIPAALVICKKPLTSFESTLSMAIQEPGALIQGWITYVDCKPFSDR